MTQKQTTAEQDLLVSLKLHNFPAELLREFAVKIVKPYFKGNINEALRNLMQSAIDEETLVTQAIKQKNK
ncbi:MAG TPA: hypothetical protein VLL96_06865 [Candidatus Deferrimicrobiaceae bacterium]|nr:hypothetical protein [Candidatus Deferrimicrobiaceae bacterium]